VEEKWIRRWIGEFAAIVLGVLVALGVDGGRQSLADRDLEQHLLQRMTVDLMNDAADLAQLQMELARREWMLWVLTAGTESPDVIPSPPDSLLDATRGNDLMMAIGRGTPGFFNEWRHTQDPWRTLARMGSFDLSDDSFREMISTGTMRVVRDQSLRASILAYYRVVEDEGENDRRLSSSREDLRDAFAEIGIAIRDPIDFAALRSAVAQDPGLAVVIRNAADAERTRLSIVFRIEQARAALERELSVHVPVAG